MGRPLVPTSGILPSRYSFTACLATDGSAALLQHAFEVLGLTSVWASTTQRNGASQRVLTKLGMRYLGIRFDQCQYEISGASGAMPRH